MADINHAYTLDEALSSIGFGGYQGVLLLYGGLGWVAEAMEVMILSFVGEAVKLQWNLSPGEESLISTMMFAGQLIGTYPWSFIADIYGRKKGFLGAVTISSIAGFLSAFSPNYISLVILRFIAGIGLGGLNTFTIWFLEFVPTPNRGTWMMIYSGFWTIGIIFEAALAWIIMPRMGWRWLIALSAVPSFIVLLFYSLIPESPRYLYQNGRLSETHIILERASLINKTNLPNGVLISDQITETSGETQKSTTGFSLIFLLLSPNLLRTTLLLWILYFGNTFAYYGILLITSKLSSGESKCGSITFLPGKSDNTSLYMDVFITSLAEVPGLIIAAIILDRVGRKLSMVTMFALGGALLLPLVNYQSWILTTTSLFGARMFISATFTVVACVYAPEVYPTNIRAMGVGVASSVGRIGGMITPLVAVGLVTNCQQTAAIIIFVLVIFLSGLSVWFFPFETKGRSLSDSV